MSRRDGLRARPGGVSLRGTIPGGPPYGLAGGSHGAAHPGVHQLARHPVPGGPSQRPAAELAEPAGRRDSAAARRSTPRASASASPATKIVTSQARNGTVTRQVKPACYASVGARHQVKPWSVQSFGTTCQGGPKRAAQAADRRVPSASLALHCGHADTPAGGVETVRAVRGDRAERWLVAGHLQPHQRLY
jgi:hypothetical protein